MIARHYGTLSPEDAQRTLDNRLTVLTHGLTCVECGARVEGERDISGIPRAALHTIRKPAGLQKGQKI